MSKRWPNTFYGTPGIYVWMTCHFRSPKFVYPRLLLISFHGDLKPISQATQKMYQDTHFKIMYIQNDSQGLIHVLGASKKIFSECVSQNCEKPTNHI